MAFIYSYSSLISYIFTFTSYPRGYLSRRKNFGHTKQTWETSMKHPREEILDPRKTYKKIFWTHETPTRKYFGPMKYPRKKILDSRFTHEKKLLTHELTTKKYFGPTKYSHTQKILNPRFTHEKKHRTQEIPTRKKARLHDSTRPTRQTMARDPRNLAHLLFHWLK